MSWLSVNMKTVDDFSKYSSFLRTDLVYLCNTKSTSPSSAVLVFKLRIIHSSYVLKIMPLNKLIHFYHELFIDDYETNK